MAVEGSKPADGGFCLVLSFGGKLPKWNFEAKSSDDATGNVELLNNIIHEVAARNVRRRILFKGKRRRKWKTSSPESLKSKGSHLKDQLKKGNNFNFAFKKIKELQQDAGKDISVSNISSNPTFKTTKNGHPALSS